MILEYWLMQMYLLNLIQGFHAFIENTSISL